MFKLSHTWLFEGAFRIGQGLGKRASCKRILIWDVVLDVGTGHFPKRNWMLISNKHPHPKVLQNAPTRGYLTLLRWCWLSTRIDGSRAQVYRN